MGGFFFAFEVSMIFVDKKQVEIENVHKAKMEKSQLKRDQDSKEHFIFQPAFCQGTFLFSGRYAGLCHPKKRLMPLKTSLKLVSSKDFHKTNHMMMNEQSQRFCVKTFGLLKESDVSGSRRKTLLQH